MALSLLKILSVGVVATLILSAPGIAPSWSADLTTLPVKAHPLNINPKKRQGLLSIRGTTLKTGTREFQEMFRLIDE